MIAFAPHAYAAAIGKFDNKSPRTYVKETEASQSVDKGMACPQVVVKAGANAGIAATKAKIARTEAAQMNGFENLGFFAAAVVMGNVAKLDNKTLNTLSAAYLASRMLYNFVYINGTSDALGEPFVFC